MEIALRQAMDRAEKRKPEITAALSAPKGSTLNKMRFLTAR